MAFNDNICEVASDKNGIFGIFGAHVSGLVGARVCAENTHVPPCCITLTAHVPKLNRFFCELKAVSKFYCTQRIESIASIYT